MNEGPVLVDFVRGQKRLPAAKFFREDSPLSIDELNEFPTRIKFAQDVNPHIKDTQRLDFVANASHDNVVSNRVKDAIESLEPGVHQFIPLVFDPVPKSILKRPGFQLFVLNCCRHIDFIDRDASRL